MPHDHDARSVGQHNALRGPAPRPQQMRHRDRQRQFEIAGEVIGIIKCPAHAPQSVVIRKPPNHLDAAQPVDETVGCDADGYRHQNPEQRVLALTAEEMLGRQKIDGGIHQHQQHLLARIHSTGETA